jgi:hypothetical protein
VVSTHLVKLGDQGLLTIALPEMTGRYVVIEQREGRVTISPMDLEGTHSSAAIAHHAGHTTLIAVPASEFMPLA